ncbi:conserved hypothetical protein [Pyrococcus abyssi virus 1]|uniref:hypothetical protein n=1 Tax=Pyrococcus abyssi virus 1 TaxID=425386 RepID=UPI00015529B3|nr:hypothetical protein PAV1_ORF180a [Pyrococcus abyssi virus 1]ABN58490.1 conserved hypothetical protein [Pyrococcus abyssi virus 1]
MAKAKNEKKYERKDKAVLHFDWRAKPRTMEDVIRMMFPRQDYYQRWAMFLIRKARQGPWHVEDWPLLVLEYLKEYYYYEHLDPVNIEELIDNYRRYDENYSRTRRNREISLDFAERFGTSFNKYYMQYRRTLGALVKAGILRKENGVVELSKRFLGWVKALYDAVNEFYLGGIEDFEDII